MISATLGRDPLLNRCGTAGPGLSSCPLTRDRHEDSENVRFGEVCFQLKPCLQLYDGEELGSLREAGLGWAAYQLHQ